MLTRFLICLFILIFTIVGGLAVGSRDYPPLKDDTAPTDSGQPPGDSERLSDLDIDAITTKFRKSLLTTNPENRRNSHTLSLIKHGIPSYDNLRIHTYMLSYDTKNKVPKWVLEYLTKEMLKKKSGVKRKEKYMEDTNIHQQFRSTNKDYSYSGQDKGHLAAAANYVSSQDANDSTFNLTNIAPQNPYMNRYRMWRNLEKHVLKLIKQEYGMYKSVHICSGPLFLPRGQSIVYETIGDNNVGVPTHFFKVLLCEVEDNKFDMESYVIPNTTSTSEPLSNFLVDKKKVEIGAGFIIFGELEPSNIRRIKTKELASGEYYNT